MLCTEEIARIPPTIGGVYLIHAFSPGHGTYPVLYAGKATDLLVRLMQHAHSAATPPEVRIARGSHRLFFSAAPVLDARLRTRIEAGLVVRLRPPFNRQIPQGAPIATSLPPLCCL